MGDSVQVGAEPPTSADAQHCLSRYYEELRQRFDEGFDPAKSVLHSLSEFDPPHGACLIVRLDGRPVACGGVTPFKDGSAYLKRMWVAPEARGHGLGRRLLAELEGKCRSLGYRTVKLETHRALGEAQTLYRSAAYREVEPFNDEVYADHWFEKALD